MTTRRNWIVVCAGLLLALGTSAPSAQANLIVDPGFEFNLLDSAANVLGNFPGYQGVWGVEAATITGVDGGVTPPEGVRMLRMVDAGAIATQAFQTTDVTSYAALIDAGGATVNLSALFDASPNLPAALGGVYLSYFTGSTYGTLTGTIGNTLTLDSSPTTWEPISVGGVIPPGTRWLLSQVAYANATLQLPTGAEPGYVDAARLDVVPEPSVLAMLGAGLFGWVAIGLRRRGR